MNQAPTIISVVVVVYNMIREAERTLYSHSAKYQRGVRSSDYEVIVVDNGTTEPLSADFVSRFGDNFRYFYFATESKSPAAAINFGVSQSSGKFVGLMLDGARILNPGVMKYALLATILSTNPIIVTLAWHLGPDVQ